MEEKLNLPIFKDRIAGIYSTYMIPVNPHIYKLKRKQRKEEKK